MRRGRDQCILWFSTYPIALVPAYRVSETDRPTVRELLKQSRLLCVCEAPHAACSTWIKEIRDSNFAPGRQRQRDPITCDVCATRHAAGVARLLRDPPAAQEEATQDAPYGSLREYVTSSTKPEVHNASQRHQEERTKRDILTSGF